MSLRIIFMGTGEFGVPALKALKDAGHTIVLVVCQPDRPQGRGQQSQAPPLKRAALELGLTMFQPEKLRAPEAVERLRELKADLGCVVSYGQILSQGALDAPRLGCVNVHGSLLPRWRGAAPIEWAVASGDAETGVCVQRMVLKLDAGDVIIEKRLALTSSDEAADLHSRLAALGAEALLEAVGRLEAGTAEARVQDETRATYAPLLKKADGFLDPGRTRADILNRYRAFKVRPGVHLQVFEGDLLKIHAMSPGAEHDCGEVGRLLSIDETKGFEMSTADGSVWLGLVQPPSGKVMSAAAYARGRHIKLGTKLEIPVLPSGD